MSVTCLTEEGPARGPREVSSSSSSPVSEQESDESPSDASGTRNHIFESEIWV